MRLRQAELHLEVARTVLGHEAGEEATVATGNAVLAGIAAGDALCCALAGSRYRGNDRRRSADHLEQVTGDAALAAPLRALVDLKDMSHYGLAVVQVSRARSAVRKVARLLSAAQARVR